MRQLLVVTHIDFWRVGAGHKARISSILSYFKDKLQVTLVYAGIFNDDDEKRLQELYPEVTFDILERHRSLTYKEYRLQFEIYIKEKNFDVVLVEYIEMSFVLPFLKKGVISLLDTHDLVSERIESFKKNNLYYDGINLTHEEEINIFNCYDYIVVIQKEDYAKVKANMVEDRVVLAPHSVFAAKKEIRKSVKSIGYIASAYSPNVDALTWFLEEVWPFTYEEFNLTLDIYGDVCGNLSEALKTKSNGVNFHGFTPNLDGAYEKIDIVINPVRCGAGLKIKNVEALSKGIPLVTTSHGATGMEEEANMSFLLSDTAEEFRASIGRLVIDYEFRLNIANSAYNYASDYFSDKNCYGELENAIFGLKG